MTSDDVKFGRLDRTRQIALHKGGFRTCPLAYDVIFKEENEWSEFSFFVHPHLTPQGFSDAIWVISELSTGRIIKNTESDDRISSIGLLLRRLEKGSPQAFRREIAQANAEVQTADGLSIRI